METTEPPEPASDHVLAERRPEGPDGREGPEAPSGPSGPETGLEGAVRGAGGDGLLWGSPAPVQDIMKVRLPHICSLLQQNSPNALRTLPFGRKNTRENLGWLFVGFSMLRGAQCSERTGAPGRRVGRRALAAGGIWPPGTPWTP